MEKNIKHHRNRNNYLYAGNNLWVRDFTKKHVTASDINNLVTLNDMNIMLGNETENSKKTLQRIDTEVFDHSNIVIVNTGHLFQESQVLLDNLGDNVVIMGVHDVLNEWKSKHRINYYVVNNPYDNCINYIPKQQNAWVRCIASKRTNYQFIEKYKGLLYQYTPVKDEYYSGLNESCDYAIDDYRNSICAAIGLAYQFKVRKIMMFCCGEGYTTQKPGTINKGLWSYPQQETAHQLIDANLYWLGKNNVKVGHYPNVIPYNNSESILKDEITNFFK